MIGSAIVFVVPRKPVSVNAAYIRAGFNAKRGRGGGKGLILSGEARDFKAAVFAYALAARARHRWPPIEHVRGVDLRVTTWNTRHDADAPVKLLQDALEGALYVRDSVVRSVTASKAKDRGEPRIDVEIILVEIAQPSASASNRTA